MSITNKTYQPVQAITVVAAENLPQFRFVSHDGTLCGDETRALGVTEIDWVSGEAVSLITLGTIIIESSEAIAAGADVTSAADGKAKTATSTDPVNGRAIEGCGSGGFARIKLVP